MKPLKKNSSDTQDLIETPLSLHVRQAVERYFSQLNGHEAVDLYTIVLNEIEKPLLEAVMVQCDHTQTKAAKALGLSRSTLRKKLDYYGLS